MKIGLVCVLFSFISLSVGGALSESLTYDEVFYLEEGRRIWNSHTFSDPYNPPLAPLLARIPTIFGFESSTTNRFVSVGLGIILIFAVYHTAGLTAAAILAFEPTFLANSHYVTNDTAVTLFVFLAAVSWDYYLKRSTKRHALLLGLAVGYALSSKMTALAFLPIAFFVGIFRSRIKKWRWVMGSACIALAVLWASYLFTWDVVLRERKDPGRVSTRLVAYTKEHNLPVVESTVTFFTQQPLPLGTYAATVKNNILRMGNPAVIFFNGALYDRSRWYFMIVNVFRKVPVPFLVLVAIGAWYQRKYAPIGIGIIGITSGIGMVPLVRYVLPAMPFLAIVAASGIRKKVLVLLLLWQIISTISYYPHFISYANAFAGSRDRRFEVLADSNLDWGQALPDVMRYVKRKGIGTMRLSYFGRLSEDVWRFEEICALRDMTVDPNSAKVATVISVSNWYYCGYNKVVEYRKEKIRDVVADAFLVF